MVTTPALPPFLGAATVLVDGEPVLEAGDHAHQRARHMVASVSKQFVAVSALVLAEQGGVDLFASVLDVLPDLGPQTDTDAICDALLAAVLGTAP